MSFDELLETYKANPRRESAMLLLQDSRLLAYAVIFKQCPPERRLVAGEPVEPVEANWTALWDCVAVDYEAIAMLADDELVKARKTVERLKGLRLVYPDGSLPELVNKDRVLQPGRKAGQKVKRALQAAHNFGVLAFGGAVCRAVDLMHQVFRDTQGDSGVVVFRHGRTIAHKYLLESPTPLWCRATF